MNEVPVLGAELPIVVRYFTHCSRSCGCSGPPWRPCNYPGVERRLEEVLAVDFVNGSEASIVGEDDGNVVPAGEVNRGDWMVNFVHG
jgi:hypothetical protein